MSTPPPFPPGPNPPPYQGPPGYQAPPPGYQGPPPGYQAPPGYQQYGMQPQQKTNGLAIASLVLSLVAIIPCFWPFPIPQILGTIFGFVARGQIKKTGAKGAGMALAGLIVGIVFILIAVLWWIRIASYDHCIRDGSSFTCYNN